jgi:hypothetical protein
LRCQFFNNADPLGDYIRVIFKTGDDLRQDLMTLPRLRIRDNMWLAMGSAQGHGRGGGGGQAADRVSG